MMREVVVLSGTRTAIGGYGGSLKDTPPSEMAARCVREAVKFCWFLVTGHGSFPGAEARTSNWRPTPALHGQ